MSDTPDPARKKPFLDLVGYATGDGANSLVMNTYFSFTMLFYTKAMGLDPILAGLALTIAILWDAITDPLMGYISDNTRSRFGRRHPYMLFGGIMMVVCFYGIWAVPQAWQAGNALFIYLVVMNLLLRTGATIFAIPHVALGFEICTDYDQRSTLQSVREAINMLVNFLGPALMGWSIFLRDRDDVKGTTIPENYRDMGLTFAIAGLVFVLIVVFVTRKYAVDTRDTPHVERQGLIDILRDLKDVLVDPYPRSVFLFIAVLFIGVVMLSSLQMFVYDDAMQFEEWEKTTVHGSTMIAAALGALVSAPLVKLLDKKKSILVLLGIGCIGNVVLLAVFTTGVIEPGMWWLSIPIAMIVFLVLHDLFHLGATASKVIAISMMADISEISRHRTGVLKDGSYSAMLSFVLKLAISVGSFMTGLAISLTGYDEERAIQTAEVQQRLMYAAFGGAAVLLLLTMLVISRYPVNREFMRDIQEGVARGEVRPSRGPSTPES
jgi:GPH family glycoside/pentoside/hexuronide:cation symporter